MKLIIFILLITNITLNAQKDFVINLRNDTVYGKIEFDFENCILSDNTDRIHSLQPNEIIALSFQNKEYYSVSPDGKLIFAEVFIKGFPISVIKVRKEEKNTVMIDGYTNPSFNIDVYYDLYYWNKSTNKYKYIKEFNFKKQAKRYFSDNPVLVTYIDSIWGYSNIDSIVNYYNRSQTEQTKKSNK